MTTFRTGTLLLYGLEMVYVPAALAFLLALLLVGVYGVVSWDGSSVTPIEMRQA
jgi:hypothetical protein